MHPGAKTHIQALTSLRFFAALAVLLFHSGGPTLRASGQIPAPIANLFANGYLGVSFFFILSGFILTHVYRGRLRDSAALRSYGIARFARVYPVYVLALVLMAPFAVVGDWRYEWQQFALLQSWLPFTDSGGYANWNMQAWTLSVELLFYLLFPALVVWLDRLTTARLRVVLACVCALILAFRLSSLASFEQLPTTLLTYVPVPVLRLPEFVFGVTLGLMHVRGVVPTAPRVLRAALVLIALVMASSGSLWVAPAASLLFGAVIALTPNSLGNGALGRFLALPVMVLLGEASYSLYLLASPVHLLNQLVWGNAWASIGRFLYIPIAVGVSILVFRLFEEPAREAVRAVFRLRPKPVTVAAE